MSNTRIYPVILAGNEVGNSQVSGGFPFHFASECGVESRFQQLLGSLPTDRFHDPIVIASEPHRFVVVEQMKALHRTGDVIVTGGLVFSSGILATVAQLFQDDPEALLMIVPAQHHFENATQLDKMLEASLPMVRHGEIVAVGHNGDKASLGFGALIRENALGHQMYTSSVRARAPEGVVAFQNTGVYIMKAWSLMAAFKRYAPLVLTGARMALANSREGAVFTRLDTSEFKGLRNTNFESAILRNLPNLHVYHIDEGYDEVSMWDADAQQEAEQALVRSPSSMAALGNKENAKCINHSWGRCEALAEGSGFFIKRIFVEPGQEFEVFSEPGQVEQFWVVQGEALITVGDERRVLEETDSVSLSGSVGHIFCNCGSNELQLIGMSLEKVTSMATLNQATRYVQAAGLRQ